MFIQKRLIRKVKNLTDIVFIKQVPSHPSHRLKRMSRKMSRNQDNIQFIKYVPPLDVQFIKQIPMHPRDRLERMVEDGEVKFIKQVPVHPKYRMIIRDSIVKVSIDKNVLEDLPYFNKNIKVNEAEKNKRKEAIFDEIIKQLPPNNDQYYIKYNKKNDSFSVKKEPKRRPLKRKVTSTTVAANKVKNKYAKRRKNKNN